HSLTETHSAFAQGTAAFKRYEPGVVLFSGYDPAVKHIFLQLDRVFNPNDSFFLFDRFPVLPANYLVETIVQCLQMICERPVHANITENLVPLGEENAEEMYTLVSRVFPGYYLPKSMLMGDFFGIFKDEKLVAMAGERLRMDGLTEISAVVTHPDWLGRKFAQQLVSHLNHKNIGQGIIPFLHTGSANERAIGIYELLGYTKRRIIPVTKIKRII
ncbi:MAG: GNAT family N-acetyltransferase, partial [Ferruginibacter sp.]